MGTFAIKVADARPSALPMLLIMLSTASLLLHPAAPPRSSLPIMMADADVAERERQLVEITPPKASALLKMWQSQSADKLVSIEADPKNPKKFMAVPTAGPGLRRAKWRSHADFFAAACAGLMVADQGDNPQARRQQIDCLHIAGFPRGEGATVYASLGGGTSTLTLVERSKKYFSVLALCVKPDEKQLGKIVEAEAATLSALYGEAAAAGVIGLRVHKTCEEALAGSRRCLGLVRPAVGMEGAGGTTWSMCGPEGAYDECEVDPAGEDDEECLIVSPISDDCVWTAGDEEERQERKFGKAAMEGFRDPKKGNSA